MNSYGIEARSLLEQYKRDVAPLLADIAKATAAHDAQMAALRKVDPDHFDRQDVRAAHDKQRAAVLEPLQQKVQERHMLLLKALDETIADARRQEHDERPANRERFVASRDATNTAALVNAMKMLEGASLRELQEHARHAVHNKNSVLAHAIRREIAKRPFEEQQQLSPVIDGLNLIHEESHGLALAHVIGAQHIRAVAVADGAFLDKAPTFATPGVSMAADDQSRAYVDESGTIRTLRSDVAAILVEQSGATDRVPQGLSERDVTEARRYGVLMTARAGKPTFEAIMANPSAGITYANAA